MKIKIFACIVIFAVTAVLVSSCSTPQQPVEFSEGQCASIVNNKCRTCHYKTRICDALGKKKPKDWQRTIDYMIRNGATVTEDETKVLVSCLSSIPAGTEFICKE